MVEEDGYGVERVDAAKGRQEENLPDLMTIDEVATYLSVSKATVYGWRKEDKAPPAVKYGKHLRFRKKAFVKWVDSVGE